MREYTKIFKALSDEGRLRIINLLSRKTLCVCEITEILQLATSTVSKHLSILREAGFITDIKDGKWVDYRLRENVEAKIKSLLDLLILWLKQNETAKQDLAKLENVDRKYICGSEKS